MNTKEAELALVEAKETESHHRFITDAKDQEKKGKSQKVAIADCFVEGNPREEHDVDQIVQSYRRHGYLLNEPIVVVKTDKGLLVVRGNRRFLAIGELETNFPEDYKVIFADGKVPAIVHNVKTDQEIALLRIDFDQSAGRRPLNKWEEFLAVRLLVKTGFHTESGIAEKMGKMDDNLQPARSWAQTRVRLAKLPRDVQEMFRPVFSPEKNTMNTLKHGDISALAKEFRSTGDSEKFREILTARANRSAPVKGKAKPKFAIPAADLKDRINSFDSVLLKQVITCLVTDGQGLAELDDAICNVESNSEMFTRLDVACPDALLKMIDALPE